MGKIIHQIVLILFGKSIEYLPLNFAHGSCEIFVVFRQISVKQKFHRAHSTFDLERYLFPLTISGMIRNAPGIGQNILLN